MQKLTIICLVQFFAIFAFEMVRRSISSLYLCAGLVEDTAVS